MTQDEIIRMAQKLMVTHGVRMCDEDGDTHGEELYCVGVEDIAEIIKQAAAYEREACARECDKVALRFFKACDDLEQFGADECAAAIRARGEK